MRFRSWNESPRRRANTSRRRSRRKAAPRPKFWPKSLPKEIASIYWPKNMYWRKPSERFVRPVRWLVAMLDAEVIPLEFDGVRAGNQSRGHRILADGPVRIPRAGAPYIEALQSAKVLSRERTRETDSQNSRRRDPHHSRRALARRQVAARYRGQPDRMAFGDSGQLRSGISGTARGSSGHGDA